MHTNYLIETDTHSINLITNGKDDFDNIVVCFHGFNGDKWGDVYSGLKVRASNSLVCSFDSCGHGKSPIPSNQMRLDTILKEIEYVVNFLHNLCPDKPINLVGGSYGGYRIMEYLVRYSPEVINKVIYVNPAFRILERLEELKDFKYNELKENDMVLMKRELNKFMHKSFLDDLFNNNLYKQTLLKTYNSTIVIGKKDSLIPVEDSLEIANKYNYPIIYVDDQHCFENKDNWQVVADIIKNGS